MTLINDYVAAKNAWKVAMRELLAAQDAAKEIVKPAKSREKKAYRELIVVTQTFGKVEVAEADEQWRKQWQERRDIQ